MENICDENLMLPWQRLRWRQGWRWSPSRGSRRNCPASPGGYSHLRPVTVMVQQPVPGFVSVSSYWAPDWSTVPSQHPQTRLVHSHWSRSVEAVLWLVGSWIHSSRHPNGISCLSLCLYGIGIRVTSMHGKNLLKVPWYRTPSGPVCLFPDRFGPWLEGWLITNWVSSQSVSSSAQCRGTKYLCQLQRLEYKEKPF